MATLARSRPAKKKSKKKSARARSARRALPRGTAALELWSQAVDQALSAGQPCTLALIDVDEFSRLNVELGPSQADRILSSLVKRLEKVLTDQALLGCLGGDQFGVALPGVDVERALGLLERLRSDVAQASFYLGRGSSRRTVELRVSVGVAGLRRDAETFAGLLEQARVGLWRAKSLGGNRLGLPAKERMALKTSYYRHSQLEQLKRLATKRAVSEALLLREALDDLLLKHKARRPQESA